MRDKKELQERAVREAAEGRPLLELALELGVSTTTLRRWISASEARTKARGSARKVATSLSREKYSEASQRMRLLIHALEQSPATIIVTDADGRIIYANPKFTETTGYSTDEAIGQTPRFLKSGFTPPEEYHRLWKTIRAGKEWRGEFRNKRKDGSLYWERASISPVFDAEGRIANFMAVKENITEYKEAEAARQQAEERFRAVVTAMAEGVLLLDPEGRIVLFNAAAEGMLGHMGEQMAGRRLDELNLRWLSERGETVPMESHPVRRAVKKGETIRQSVYALLPPSGELRWISINAGPVSTSSGAQSTTVVSFSDITERKGAEERLKLVGSAFDNSVEAIMITDGDNRIVSVNAAFSEITGYSRGEVIGKSPSLLASGRHSKAFYRDMWEALAAAGRWQGEIWNRRKDGRLYPAWLSISVVRAADGSVDQYVTLFFDMSERSDRIRGAS
ncbi:MAG: PAS domain S-box protein [Candidatus Nitricoxidivorans perseverans]|uniref:PAS domain S-box protein n=1 Tax=Candidatus Nitricoxidivorans perseverans TaxID=2975601 RepID=A0AA49FJX3_9PROT|nr:MAG: PAS domain S-box protein [Candidatus Nitricoxidivorans perseverans]